MDNLWKLFISSLNKISDQIGWEILHHAAIKLVNKGVHQGQEVLDMLSPSPDCKLYRAAFYLLKSRLREPPAENNHLKEAEDLQEQHKRTIQFCHKQQSSILFSFIHRPSAPKLLLT